jgi:hypothetical protein
MPQSDHLTPASRRAGILPDALAGFTASLREHTLLVAIVGLHLLAVMAMPWVLGRPLDFHPGLAEVTALIWLIGFWTVLLFAIGGFLVAAIRHGRSGPLAAAFGWLRRDFLRRDRIWGGLIVFALLPVFGWDFGFLKALIPFLHPYGLDPTFAAWDKALHFGRAPWEWLQPALGFPPVTSGLSLVYALWFMVLYGVAFWQAFDRRNPALRMQYLLCTILLWAVLGNVGGPLLASGGPVYYGRLTGLPDPFLPLFQYLDAANREWLNFSRDIQEKLWGLYLTNGEDGVIANSISAMPSLHLASSFAFYLVARATNRWLGWVFLVFVVLMLLGSVHLGWHYAIDGYAGIAGTTILWWGCGCVVRRPAMQRFLWPGIHRVAPPPMRRVPAKARI